MARDLKSCWSIYAAMESCYSARECVVRRQAAPSLEKMGLAAGLRHYDNALPHLQGRLLAGIVASTISAPFLAARCTSWRHRRRCTWNQRRGRAKASRRATCAQGSPVADASAPEHASGWRCVERCGACCYLAPENRPYLEDLLSLDEMETFRGLVGPDGWCRHYDHQERACGIYESRPVFCRVKTWLAPKATVFGVDTGNELEVARFCASCCREHIAGVHGEDSSEMLTFNAQVPVGLEEEDTEDYIFHEGQQDAWEETDLDALGPMADWTEDRKYEVLDEDWDGGVLCPADRQTEGVSQNLDEDRLAAPAMADAEGSAGKEPSDDDGMYGGGCGDAEVEDFKPGSRSV